MCFLLILSHHQVLDTRYSLLVARYLILVINLKTRWKFSFHFVVAFITFKWPSLKVGKRPLNVLLPITSLHCIVQASPVQSPVQREADSIKLWLHAFDPAYEALARCSESVLGQLAGCPSCGKYVSATSCSCSCSYHCCSSLGCSVKCNANCGQ